MNEAMSPLTLDDTFTADPRAWLAARMSPEMRWLLAFADDGLIWGTLEANGALRLSSDVFNEPQKYPAIAVELRSKTLQQARIFGPAGELLIWRTANGFQYRQILDDQMPPAESFDEEQLVWGTKVQESRGGFALLVEGAQGMQHAPPIDLLPDEQRLRLTLRHYLEFDNQNQAYIHQSRLVRLG